MFTVTRQHRWPDGIKIVEISQGGLDYTNPGALMPRWAGEGEEYLSPVQAVEVGIGIAKAWQEESKEPIYLGMGNTHGMTGFFDEQELTEETFESFLAKATELEGTMKRCDRCGELLGKKTYRLADDWTGERFCSEYCVEESFRDNAEQADEEE